MFAIPQKESSALDWAGPLRSYLARVYGTSSEYGSDAAVLQTLRQNALGAARNTGGRDLLYRYFVQLNNLSLRIPISEHGCRLSFSWRDLYGGKEITQHSAAFEKAAVLFNLAAVLWQIGLDAEETKPAFAAFQAAAGVYKLIAENFIHAPSPDFAAETTQTLEKVALGHAQALFVLNSAAKAPSSLLFRLSRGASILYTEAADGLERIYATSWGERQWQTEIRFLAKYWDAYSVYHHALHLDSNQHGLALSYMRQAKTQFSQIFDDLKTKFASTKDVSGHLELATRKLREMEKDNDLLYHEREIPITGEIPHTIAATPTPIDKIYSGAEMEQVIGKQLFANIVPLEVHETASLYSDELDKLRRHEQEKVSIANQELSSALEYLDLPHAARVLKEPTQDSVKGVPTAVKEWSRQISASPALDFEFSSRHQILALLESLPSSQHDQRQRIKASLVQASNQDATLKQQYEAIRTEIQELQDPIILDRMYAAPNSQQQDLLDLDTGAQARVDADLQQTLDHCEKLRKIEKERATVFTDLKQRLIDDDISSALVANRKTMKPQDIFDHEIEKFNPFIKRINATVNHQRTLLAELTVIWRQVLANPQVKREASAREQYIVDTVHYTDRYRNAYQKWLGLHEGATQARQFYQQLLEQVQGMSGASSGPTSSSLDLGTLSDSLPRVPPPIPARVEANSAYSTPSAFNSDMYTKPQVPPKY